ncbi:DUF3566 domain-containing protein [Arthrobacter glacialis]|uniref:DUF3566 domain-containing protein n=1 Tax=Arthrobacter glacialis TaxID=1664 RepID=A0A2S3ZXG3_ARTGL|nr:DUF3566 domain-containing protein [Arthrobacter glacialis]POH59468.1 hypothetical protein CVS28_08390 [Arthrobacter glacialis]POH73764.1 hypothetical protein CVS27_07485 [Arthrobacter glacialis]
MSANNPIPRPGSAPRVGAPARPPQRPGVAPATTTSAAAKRPAPKPAPKTAPALVKPAPKAKARRARLLVSKVEPWSVLKMAFLLSVALGIVTVVASIVLWTVLDTIGLFDTVNSFINDIQGKEGGTPIDLLTIVSLGQVASFSTIVAVVNVLLLTTLSVLSAFLYNISATLVGGIGVTLTDD